MALVALELAELVQDQPAESAQHGREAVASARARNEPFELAWTLAYVGIQYSMDYEDPWGTEIADESLELARALGNSYVLAFALQAVGLTRVRTDPARAIALLEASLVRARRPPLPDMRAIKAVAHVKVNDERGAAAELLIALPSLQEMGKEYFISMSLAPAATIFHRRGRPDLAIQILAMNQRLRDDGRMVGARHDLERQASLRSRLESEVEPETFASNWATGSDTTIDAMLTVVLSELTAIAGQATTIARAP
jgi:hypothetical protein